MSEHLYLPALSKTRDIKNPEKGQWADQGPGIILNIANAIDPPEQASKKGISSIPDIWARPLMFHSAIRQNSKHPLKEKLINEWRGLMSLLALSKFKKYPITIAPVKLEGYEKQKFVKALLKLKPKGIKLEENLSYNWIDPELKEPILIIKYKKVSIGSFCPSTLVYTGADYAGLLKIVAPELSDFLIDSKGFLIPPTKETDKEEIEFVGEWLEELKIRFGRIVNTDDEVAKHTIENINGLINDWLKEIRLILKKAPDTVINADGVKVSDQMDSSLLSKPVKFFEENKYKFYQYLLCPLIKDESFIREEKYSEITLDWVRNLTDFKEIVIISERLLGGGKKIWNPKALKDLGGGDGRSAIDRYFNKEWGTVIDTESIDFPTNDGKKAGMWIRPELYFLTDVILKAKEGDFINKTENSLNPNSYVWPFKKEILNFFSPIEIKENLKPEIIPVGSSVKFSFTLPVSGVDFKIEKVYKSKGKQEGEGEILETDVPVIEIFPDYIGKNWRRYYLLQSHVENFSISPILPTLDYKQNTRISNILIDKNNRKVKINELRGDNIFPEGVEILSQKEEYLGLILIDKHANWDPKVLKNTMEIGIDFGTSNTNVYFNEGKILGERWCYDFPEYIRQITSSDATLRAEALNNSFIPTKKHDLPIPTALLNKYNTLEKPALLLDYFIFFANGYNIPSNVFTNLKWEQDNQDTDLQKKSSVNNTDWFIESLLFLIFLDVCKKNIETLIIGCSYPKAFSQNDRSRFGRLWQDALEKLYSGEDRIINVYDKENPDDDPKPSIFGPFLLREGIATGYFFANPKKFISTKDIDEATLSTGAICLDVGGATTDISIWCDTEEKALFDTSILIAGKEICEYIRTKPELWTILFSPEGKKALNEKKNNEDQFAAMLNMVLKSEEKEVFTNLSKNNKNSALQSLLKIILIEFGAMAYYTSLLCLTANEKSDNNSLITKIQESGINLYWGGNGAKFISWLDFGLFNSNSTCVKFLNTIFFYGLDLHNVNPNELILQFASPEPKSEACGGLIVSEHSQRETLDGSKNKGIGYQSKGNVVKINISGKTDDINKGGIKDQNIDFEFVCGEKIEFTDSTFLDCNNYINNSILFKDKKTLVKNTTLSELVMFVDVLNATAIALGLLKQGNEIVLDEEIKANIKNDILNRFKGMQTKELVMRRIEPIFIMEVKKLIQEIGK